MTITRYFSRYLSTTTTIIPVATPLDEKEYRYLMNLYGNKPAFEFHNEYTDTCYGDELHVKMTTYVTNTPAVVQFIELTGEESVVKQEEDYLRRR